jgi:hypothetical protein
MVYTSKLQVSAQKQQQEQKIQCVEEITVTA